MAKQLRTMLKVQTRNSMNAMRGHSTSVTFWLQINRKKMCAKHILLPNPQPKHIANNSLNLMFNLSPAVYEDVRFYETPARYRDIRRAKP